MLLYWRWSVSVKGEMLTNAGFVNFFWAFFLGSCRICQPTEEVLRNTGSWSKIDLARPVAQPSPFQVLPHTYGTLTK